MSLSMLSLWLSLFIVVEQEPAVNQFLTQSAPINCGIAVAFDNVLWLVQQVFHKGKLLWNKWISDLFPFANKVVWRAKLGKA